MPDRSDLIVGGYFFGSFEDSAIAQKELKNAKYLEERLNSMRPSQMKSVYDKMLDEKVHRIVFTGSFIIIIILHFYEKI